MRILIDESIDVDFWSKFPKEHDAMTVQFMGWLSYGNGALLALARLQFDAFITFDHHIPEQQNLTEEDVRVVVLYAYSNRADDLEPMVPEILEALENMRRGEVERIYSPDFLV